MTYESYEKIMLRFVAEESFSAAFKKYNELPPGNGPDLARELKEEALLDFTKLIRGSIFTDKYVYGVKLVLPSGALLTSAGGKNLEAKEVKLEKAAGYFSKEPWFIQAIERGGDLVWLDTNPEGISGDSQPTFGMSRLVKDAATGNPAYVVMLEIKADALADQLRSLDLGDQGVKAIVNASDTIIYSEQPELIGSGFAIRLSENGEQRSSIGKETFTNEEGQIQLVSYARSIERNDWYMVTAVPVSELVRDSKQILNMVWMILVVAAVVTVLIGVYMVATVGRPLIRLRNLMVEGEQGILTVRANIRRKDEIGEVGHSFNRMMDTITELVQHTNRSADEVLSTAAELSSVSQSTALAAKEISAATE
ncbi:HAMP domain-containing protein [Cohnella yongneupensis]|uniref:histidine kinase n=1 Tax=Cohnella yongneupensis TaxID=425006 RepID=A0ABW0QXK3_9BACL